LSTNALSFPGIHGCTPSVDAVVSPLRRPTRSASSQIARRMPATASGSRPAKSSSSRAASAGLAAVKTPWIARLVCSVP
jgi:hypothetical protein